ncbi:MAG: phage holin, LLH family [Eubacteriales bacterium]|nr:phage holin, LLH family [Eubacteriales bacterium]
MTEVLIEAAKGALSILIPLAVAACAEFVRRRLGVERIRKVQAELRTKQELAFVAVKFAEQFIKDGGGREKYEAASEWLSAQASKQGIKISSSEIRGLIEWALRDIKDELGNHWAGASGCGEGCTCQSSR